MSAGQSVTDRINAAKHSLTGQGLAKAVCKSTTEEVSGPKRKHLDYLLQCTHETNVSVPQMADLLIQRTQTTNWVVVFKSLITVHNVMNYGSERFYQYLASSNCSFRLDNFIDKAHPQGYDMSTYIRKYAKYINEKATAYRLMAFDFCKVKRGKEDGLLRTMVPEKLLKALPILQDQLDALLEFDPSLNELNNGVINAAFLLLFKDLIRLFACYNDGIINLLEKYFDMNRKQCKEALEIYKKFLVRMDQTGEFLKVAEPWAKKQNVGIDKGDIPDLTKAPASLLEALEAHLKSLEGKKASKLHAGGVKVGNAGLTDEEKKRILADEEKELQRMKSPGDKPKKAKKKRKERKEKTQTLSAHMESASQVPAQQTTQVIPPQATPVQMAAPVQAAIPSASDDLLALDVNPFQAKANNVMSVANNSQWMNQNPLDPMSLSPAPSQPPPGSFTSETGFASAFGTTQPSSMPGMLLQPMAMPQASQPINQQNQDLLDLDIGAPVSEGTTADETAVASASNISEEAPVVSASVEPEATEEGAGDESVEAPAALNEPVPDLLTSTNNILCVTIGGQNISINTKPSGSASVSGSAENSMDSSPRAGRHTPQPEEAVVEDPQVTEELEEEPENGTVMDLLADFSSPPEAQLAPAEPLNSDIMDLLGGLDNSSADPIAPPLQGTIDVVTIEHTLPPPAVMLLPTSVAKEAADLLQPTNDINGETDNLDDIQPSPVLSKLPDVAIVPTSSSTQSPKPSLKISKPPPTPSNPLEAAMFKQLFPELPKAVVKKSLAEMQAESGAKSPGVSPAITRRDSRNEVDTGQVLMPLKKEDQAVADSKLVKKDLDSSLASLTDSKLMVTPGIMKKGNLQWGPEQPKKMTGGQNFAGGMPAATSTWAQPQQPMGQPLFMPAQPQQPFISPQQPFIVQQQQPYPYMQQNYNPNPYLSNMPPPMYQPPMQQQLPTLQPQTTNNNPDLFSM